MYVFLFLIFNGITCQVVYILDQVRALENEMLLRIKQQGLDITPKILIVRIMFHFLSTSIVLSVRRLLSKCAYMFLFVAGY